MKKKFLSLISCMLVLVMTGTSMHVDAFAAEETSSSEVFDISSSDEQSVTDTDPLVPDSFDMDSFDTDRGSDTEDSDILPSEESDGYASEEPEEADGLPASDDASPDGQDPSDDLLEGSALTVKEAHIMYGEDGSNETGNLDKLFGSSYTVDGTEVTDSVTFTYRFYTDLSAADGFSGTDDDSAGTNEAALPADPGLWPEGDVLSDIPAGTQVLAAVFASGDEIEPAVATAVITIEKRPITIHIERSRDASVSEKEMPDDEKIVITEADDAYSKVEIKVAEGSGDEEASMFMHADELSAAPADVLSGNIILDVSDADMDSLGFQEVPADASLEPGYADNYVIPVRPIGYVYVEESTYAIMFRATSGGKMNYSILNNLLHNDGISGKKLNDMLSASKKSEIMALAEKSTIYGWSVTMNGHYYTTVDPDFKEDGNDFYIYQKEDYCFTAQQYRAVSENIFIDAVPAVYYDGRAHVSDAEVLKDSAKKSTVNDLQLRVFYLADEDLGDFDRKVLLRYGTDYKVTYKNNKESTMRVDPYGRYNSIFKDGDDKKRPSATITGVGNYKGFSATVFFDILPYNFGEVHNASDPIAQVSGLKHTYTLKTTGGKKKLAGISDPTVTLAFGYASKPVKLTKGKDYEIKVYRYDSSKWQEIWCPNLTDIDQNGRYLIAIRGLGNYCGYAFGQTSSSVFSPKGQDGTVRPSVCSYDDSSYYNCQFIVSDPAKDLANAAVTIRKIKVPYEPKKIYTGASDSLGISVKVGAYTLTENVDYTVTFTGSEHTEVIGRYAGTAPYVYITSPVIPRYEGEIYVADSYKVSIHAIAGSGYYGSKDTGKTVSINGVDVEPKWFKMIAPDLVFDGTNSNGECSDASSDMPVSMIPGELDSYYSASNKSTLGSYVLYNYKKELRDKHMSTGSKKDYYGVRAFSDYPNKMPGTYGSSILPIGPGVSRGTAAKVQFKRKPDTMQHAVDNGLIKVACDPSTAFNVAGGLPENVRVTYGAAGHTKINYLGDMVCNKQTYKITDADGDSITITLEATNNMSPRTASLSITGDGKVLKGSVRNICSYNVNVRNVSKIKCLSSSGYSRVYGKKTETVPVSDSAPIGTIYAVMATQMVEKNNKIPSKPQIKLYQSYYESPEEARDGRASLMALKANQFTAELTSDEYLHGGFYVKIKNKALPANTGLDFGTGISLTDTYDVYDEKVTIVSATVKKSMYGIEYTLPDKNAALPYTGGQVIFDTVEKIKIKSKTDGEVELGPTDFTWEYGDNVTAGKNKGTLTITLRKNGYGFRYGGSKTFTFNIDDSADVSL
ncbi:MAG: hypothetical protein K6G58_05140 [Lachnospiraceae bacterium]|nr:hypothetical protein [Lachnospiraceae bacterium]